MTFNSSIVAKIQDGTRTLAKGNMCKTCMYSIRVRGDNDSNVINRCTMLEENLKFEVADCNSYKPANMPNLRDMYEIAWIVRTDKKTRQVGFQPYSEWKKDEKNKEEVEDVRWGL